MDLSVYLVTDTAQCAARGRSVAETVALAVAGGVTAVQIREKHADGGEFLRTVLEVAAVLPERVALIVNDRVDVFLAARAMRRTRDGCSRRPVGSAAYRRTRTDRRGRGSGPECSHPR